MESNRNKQHILVSHYQSDIFLAKMIDASVLIFRDYFLVLNKYKNKTETILINSFQDFIRVSVRSCCMFSVLWRKIVLIVRYNCVPVVFSVLLDRVSGTGGFIKL